MLSHEETIQQQLGERFDCLKDKVRIPRIRRLFAQVPAAEFPAVFEYAVRELDFTMLSAITGLDEGATLGLIYHLAQENGIVLNLATSLPKDEPVLQTVTAYFPAADAYERELVDLLGFQVEGLPPGNRYPLPDDWPDGQYPLRKDWNVKMLDPNEKEAA